MTSAIVIGGHFLSREICTQVVREIERDGCWQWGEINYGGRSHVDLDFRRVQWCPIPRSCRTVIAARLLAIARGLAAHFGPVRSFEGPNLLRYRPGDFFHAHPDENPRTRLRPRKVTITAFLNDGDFDGGILRLQLRSGTEPFDILPCAGRFVAFPASTVHEVSTISAGNRYALVAWLH
jgi:predicted 2-oxoglutarate/Fe(II)-dependent dioxygenase YbiX